VPATAVEQVGQRRVDREERPVPVHRAHLERVGERLLAERTVVRHAGVGGDELEAAGRAGEAVDGGPDRVRLRDIAASA
jgi:hypothetical protein